MCSSFSQQNFMKSSGSRGSFNHFGERSQQRSAASHGQPDVGGVRPHEIETPLAAINKSLAKNK